MQIQVNNNNPLDPNVRITVKYRTKKKLLIINTFGTELVKHGKKRYDGEYLDFKSTVYINLSPSLVTIGEMGYSAFISVNEYPDKKVRIILNPVAIQPHGIGNYNGLAKGEQPHWLQQTADNHKGFIRWIPLAAGWGVQEDGTRWPYIFKLCPGDKYSLVEFDETEMSELQENIIWGQKNGITMLIDFEDEVCTHDKPGNSRTGRHPYNGKNNIYGDVNPGQTYGTCDERKTDLSNLIERAEKRLCNDPGMDRMHVILKQKTQNFQNQLPLGRFKPILCLGNETGSTTVENLRAGLIDARKHDVCLNGVFYWRPDKMQKHEGEFPMQMVQRMKPALTKAKYLRSNNCGIKNYIFPVDDVHHKMFEHNLAILKKMFPERSDYIKITGIEIKHRYLKNVWKVHPHLGWVVDSDGVGDGIDRGKRRRPTIPEEKAAYEMAKTMPNTAFMISKGVSNGNTETGLEDDFRELLETL